MNWSLAFPVFIGLLAVLQTGLSKRMASSMDLSGVVLLTTLTASFLAAGLFFLSRYTPDSFPPLFRPRSEGIIWAWWYFIPGVSALSFAVGMPFATVRLGAVQVFIALIAAQIVGGLFWDYLFEQRPISLLRIIGIAFVLIGVVLVTLESSKHQT